MRSAVVLFRWLRVRGPKTGPISSSVSGAERRELLKLKTNRRFPSPAQWSHLLNFLSARERFALKTAAAAAALSFLALLTWGYTTHLAILPAAGGTYTEGLIGTPQFINPLYAPLNDTDMDITRLIYSGLMKWSPELGLVPDLAESYSVSEDGKTYTFTLRQGATWHDGEIVSVRDVIFTFVALQNPAYQSPLISSFRTVSVEQADERTVVFRLSEPFRSFLASLTVGILPAHIWEEYDPSVARLADVNLSPVGSGPYKFLEYEKDKKGAILLYRLARYSSYFAGTPYIEKLDLKFYQDASSATDALLNKRIEGIAYLQNDGKVTIKNTPGLKTPSLPQVNTLFFNIKRDIFSSRSIREALGAAIDKNALVENAAGGFGIAINSTILANYASGYADSNSPAPFAPEHSKELLDKEGWKIVEGNQFREKGEGDAKKTLDVVITTVNQPEPMLVAGAVAEAWKNVGVNASVKPIDVSELRDETLKNRAYDVFLGGALLGAESDPYPFWHSSQATYPGLNLSGYANRKADELIVNARRAQNEEERNKTYSSLAILLNEDIPAIPLYESKYLYAPSEKIRGIVLAKLLVPSDRFGNIEKWYLKTKKGFRW